MTQPSTPLDITQPPVIVPPVATSTKSQMYTALKRDWNEMQQRKKIPTHYCQYEKCLRPPNQYGYKCPNWDPKLEVCKCPQQPDTKSIHSVEEAPEWFCCSGCYEDWWAENVIVDDDQEDEKVTITTTVTTSAKTTPSRLMQYIQQMPQFEEIPFDPYIPFWNRPGFDGTAHQVMPKDEYWGKQGIPVTPATTLFVPNSPPQTPRKPMLTQIREVPLSPYKSKRHSNMQRGRTVPKKQPSIMKPRRNKDMVSSYFRSMQPRPLTWNPHLKQVQRFKMQWNDPKICSNNNQEEELAISSGEEE